MVHANLSDAPRPGDQAPPSTLGARARRLVDRIGTAIEDCRQRYALSSELADLCRQGQLDEVLGEIGLTRAQIPALIRGHPGSVRSLGRMLERLGIDRHRITAALSLHDLAWRCTTCEARRTCRRWLESGAHAGYEAFCPNADTLDRLQRPAGSPDRA